MNEAVEARANTARVRDKVEITIELRSTYLIHNTHNITHNTHDTAYIFYVDMESIQHIVTTDESPYISISYSDNVLRITGYNYQDTTVQWNMEAPLYHLTTITTPAQYERLVNELLNKIDQAKKGNI